MKKAYIQLILSFLLPLFQVSLVTYLILFGINLITDNFVSYYLDFKLWTWLLIFNALMLIICRKHARPE